MSFLKFAVITAISAILFWISWLAVVFFQQPTTAGSLIFFYFCLFFALLGTFTLLGAAGRYFYHHDAIVYKFVDMASREAVLLSLLVVLTLFLQSQRLLTWWNSIFLLLCFGLLEVFFVSYKKNNKKI